MTNKPAGQVSCGPVRRPVLAAVLAAVLAVAAAAGAAACKSERVSPPPSRQAENRPASAPASMPAAAPALAAASASGAPPAPARLSATPAEDAVSAALAEDAGCPGLPAMPSRYPAAERIVAIGDLHGDLASTRAALELAGAIDSQGRWSGGTMVLVQTGDILDRGDDEQAILDLFERLAVEAKSAGGAVHVLNGNHELMNAAGDFRYVTEGGFRDFEDVPGLDVHDDHHAAVLAELEPELRPRAAAFLPGGPYARILARHNVAVVVGDTVFVHGGISPAYAEQGLEIWNRESRCWLIGNGGPPSLLSDSASPIWSRDYSQAPEACDDLGKALALVGAKRMVVGHTVQLRGITAACNQRVWRIDVGLADYYGGPTQVLEIRGDQVKVLKKR